MRKYLTIGALTLVTAGLAWAQAAAVIPSGTQVTVRINETLDTRVTNTGDKFTAVLVTPIRTSSGVAVPAGTPFTGRVAISDPSGRLKGRAVLLLTLDSFQYDGNIYPVTTANQGNVSKSHKGRNRALIGGGAGVGAVVGAVTGGVGGAAVGALVGGGGGTAAAALTGKKQIAIPAESVMTFELMSPVMI
jgi:hypothetical protein